DALVPLVFILIIGTVVLQSATARPLARWLGVAEPEPRGVLVFGADEVPRAVAKALHDGGIRVLLADDDWEGIRRARMDGLATFFGNPTSSHADRHLDLTGIGRLLAMSTHRERNSLACLHYRDEFGRDKVYRLRNLGPEETTERAALAESLLAPPLFEEGMTHGRFAGLLERGWRIKSTRLTTTFDWPHFVEQYGSASILLFGIEEKGALRVASTKRELQPRPGWMVIALVPPAVAGEG
ncbi:NAD-binding protein, partial [Thiomonas sp.]|uniref:NAD-binding protein n=1 Tax=Thiomonas sp. TaxID=2047785 RepID=UPI00258E94DA